LDGDILETATAWVREQRDIGDPPGILPRLRTVPPSEIAKAAGCSKASASDIGRGKWAPHVSTWAALATMVGAEMLERGAIVGR
jgi:hypothetical protein